MAYSGIGGQAVMEGVEMLNGTRGAVAVRLQDGTIHTDDIKITPEPEWVKKTPIVRGVYSFFNSLIIGIGTLFKSASYFEDEDEKEKKKEKSPAQEKAEMGVTLLISFVIAIAVFLYLPMFLSDLMSSIIKVKWVVILLEGIIRIVIFLLYIRLIGKTEDIHRTFMHLRAIVTTGEKATETFCTYFGIHEIPKVNTSVSVSSIIHHPSSIS
ncbi:MAG: DUF1385 domain-containing protein, partial [Lachnospiraceae bacterium]|nr:DUF1385 domain-containing protein [Lachnospiraceae bacterium]